MSVHPAAAIRVVRVACAALALLACAMPAAARAGVGGLDPAFGAGGFATTALNLAAKEGRVELGAAPDGSAAVGEVAGFTVRFGPEGSPDATFGESGRLRLVQAPVFEGGAEDEGRRFFPGDVVVDSEGRLLVFGQETDTRRAIPLGTITGELAPESWAVVLRFTPQGKPDPTFGEGRGFIRSGFGLRSRFSRRLPMVTALAGSVDSRDRPVLVAGVTEVFGGCYAKGGQLRMYPRAVVRLTEAGQTDRSFGGGDGLAPIIGFTEFPGLGIDGRDRPVVGVGSLVQPEPECRGGTTLIRLREDGRRMRGFGPRGTQAFKRADLSFVAHSGAIVLADQHRRTLRVTRLRPSGDLDAGFGRAGTAGVRLPLAVGNHVSPVAADAQGRVLLAGFLGRDEPFSGPKKGPKHPSLAVARLLPDGRMDPSFGEGGWIITAVPEPLEVTSTAAALDPQGRLLLTASVTAPDEDQGGYLLARYLLGP
jgi:uncharacterized delta-60 repeat protein